MIKLPVLSYLERLLDGSLTDEMTTHMQYPTPISQTLGIRLMAISEGTAIVEIDANSELHGNQQGTIHGGLLCELADAAIGTAHSTTIAEGETFTSIELKIDFYRPVWKSTLQAIAKPLQIGKTITRYVCEIKQEDGKTVAMVNSTLMTLRGEKAVGR